MKKTMVLFMVLGVTILVPARNKVPVSQWLMTSPGRVYLPAFAGEGNIEGKTFGQKDLLDAVGRAEKSPSLSWKKVDLQDPGELPGNGEHRLIVLKTWLKVDRWVRGKLEVTMNVDGRIRVDDGSVYAVSGGEDSQKPVVLDSGKHKIMIRLLSGEEPVKIRVNLSLHGDFKKTKIEVSTDPDHFLTIHDILNGVYLDSASISPGGRYVLIQGHCVEPGRGKRQDMIRLYDLNEDRYRFSFRCPEWSQVQWLPRSDRISFVTRQKERSNLFVYDPADGRAEIIARGLERMQGLLWSPTEDYILFYRGEPVEKPAKLKRIHGVEDRLPHFRNRSTLHKIDLKTGHILPLTAGHLSPRVHDIRDDGSRVLFSTSVPDYSRVPFRKQNLYELNPRTMKVKPVWEGKPYRGQCQYSPDGDSLLVLGGGECFGDTGVHLKNPDRKPNPYDGQLYIYDLDSRRVRAVTREFDPSVDSAFWSPGGDVYLSVTRRDYRDLYRYRLKSGKFLRIPTSVDVLNDVDFAGFSERAVYRGTSITSPEKLYLLNLKKGTSRLLWFPDAEKYEKIRFGETGDWNFTNSRGTKIYGRVYYPPDYDPGQSYPLIVNYYGGTSPVERSFGGRYPINIWAAEGYLVYVLQPSGSTGFGQDFSALHVNGWGVDAIDDIIDGTRKFLKAHPQADPERVGCIGASYGGYTTMLLQTRTDLFHTAVSHAGISSISSYWGEGYWGYTYNAGAARGSYPWNRRDIYVDNSPLYNADQFQNSILLLHGTADTNVPVGESLQYYAALKLLGKEVEMVLVKDQDHWIVDYEKRVRWHHTIMAWFDNKLKSQPGHWEHMYPEKNL